MIVAAGDIGDCATTGDEATADLLDGIPGTVAVLGDIAYPNGTAANFHDCYAPSWGRHRSRTRPAVGNHEYTTSRPRPRISTTSAAPRAAGKGWYSYDLGAWHVVVLNSNCSRSSADAVRRRPRSRGSRRTSPRMRGDHVLAYFHHPRYSSGLHGNEGGVQTLWEVLYAAGAELVLNGHDHSYERFAPQDPWGRADAPFGIRAFVVGTGGTALRPKSRNVPNSEVFSATHGVLKLTLRADGYDWAFVPIAGKTFTDAGSGTTHGPPPARTRRAFTSKGDTWVDQAHSTRNYGHATTLVIDGDTGNGMDAHAYVKVKVSDTTGVIDRAALRLWVTDKSKDGPTVAPTTTSWTPNTMTWRTRAPATGPAVSDMGAAAAGGWVELDVTPLVTRTGTFGFVLRPTSSDGLDVSSNQGAHPPHLVVETLPAP